MELSRSLTALRELDAASHVELGALQQQTAALLPGSAAPPSPKARAKALAAINTKFKACLSHGQAKVDAATQIYNVVRAPAPCLAPLRIFRLSPCRQGHATRTAPAARAHR